MRLSDIADTVRFENGDAKELPIEGTPIDMELSSQHPSRIVFLKEGRWRGELRFSYSNGEAIVALLLGGQEFHFTATDGATSPIGIEGLSFRAMKKKADDGLGWLATIALTLSVVAGQAILKRKRESKVQSAGSSSATVEQEVARKMHVTVDA